MVPALPVTLTEGILAMGCNVRVRLVERVRLEDERVRLTFTPKWIGDVEVYAKKFAQRNVWKVMPILDADDLTQEYYFVYLKVVEKGYTFRNKTHFMGLFTTSIRNKTITLANKRTRRNEVAADGLVDGFFEEMFDQSQDSTDHKQEWQMMLEDAPVEVKQFFQRGMDKPIGDRFYQREDGIRETGNQRVCRLAELDPATVDLQGSLQRWMTGE